MLRISTAEFRYLLPRKSQKTRISPYDESIVAYLYCLNKT